MPTAAEQMRRMLEQIETRRDEHCQKVLEDADGQAQAIIQEAFAKGRQRVHDVVHNERQRVQRRCREAEAQRQTARREHAHRVARALLDRTRERLIDRLRELWQDGGQRRFWLDRALETAVQRFPRQPWTATHGPDLEVTDREHIENTVAEHTGQAVTLQADPAITAGVRLAAGQVILDATLEGLTRDRARLEARLLALIEEQKQPADDPDGR